MELKVNKAKSGKFLFKSIKGKGNVFDGIPISRKYKYLRVELDHRGSTRIQVRVLQNKIYFELDVFKAKGMYVESFRATIRNSTEAFYKADFNTNQAFLEQTARKSFKKIIGMPKCTPYEVISRIMTAQNYNGLPRNITVLYCLLGKILSKHKVAMSDSHFVEQQLDATMDQYLQMLKGINVQKQFRRRKEKEIKELAVQMAREQIIITTRRLEKFKIKKGAKYRSLQFIKKVRKRR